MTHLAALLTFHAPIATQICVAHDPVLEHQEQKLRECIRKLREVVGLGE